MAAAKKIDIFVVPINGIDVRFTYSNNVISYFFQYKEKNYGNALNILKEGKKKPNFDDCIKGGAVLMLNAVESINSLTNESTGNN